MSIIPKGDNLQLVNDAMEVPISGLQRPDTQREYRVKSWHPKVEVGVPVEIHCVLVPRPFAHEDP